MAIYEQRIRAGVPGRCDLNTAYKNYQVIIGENEEGGQDIQWINPYVTVQVVRGVGRRQHLLCAQCRDFRNRDRGAEPGESLPVDLISATVLEDGYKWIKVDLGQGVVGYMQVDLDYLRFLI